MDLSFFMRTNFSYMGHPIMSEHRRMERWGGCRGECNTCLHTGKASKQEVTKLFMRACKLWRDLGELGDSPEESESSSEKTPPTPPKKQRSEVTETKAEHTSPRRAPATSAVKAEPTSSNERSETADRPTESATARNEESVATAYSYDNKITVISKLLQVHEPGTNMFNIEHDTCVGPDGALRHIIKGHGVSLRVWLRMLH